MAQAGQSAPIADSLQPSIAGRVSSGRAALSGLAGMACGVGCACTLSVVQAAAAGPDPLPLWGGAAIALFFSSFAGAAVQRGDAGTAALFGAIAGTAGYATLRGTRDDARASATMATLATGLGLAACGFVCT